MTQNKPVIAEEARKLLTGANSKLENDMLDMVSRLADVITYNAKVMNKLVKRVEQLEALEVKPQVAPLVKQKQGEYLEMVLQDKSATKVCCTKTESGAYIEGKVCKVEYDAASDTPYVTNEHREKCAVSSSLFVKVENEPVRGRRLHVLLADPTVQRVKCVTAHSRMWKEGKVYGVLVGSCNKVQCEEGTLETYSRSLFVEVKPEPSKVMYFANHLRQEQHLNMFLEQTRMFMGLPTIHLIKPCSL